MEEGSQKGVVDIRGYLEGMSGGEWRRECGEEEFRCAVDMFEAMIE